MWIRNTIGVLLSGLLCLAAGPSAARPTIYQWVDQEGLTHYATDPKRVPRNVRGLINKKMRATTDDDSKATASYWWSQDTRGFTGSLTHDPDFVGPNRASDDPYDSDSGALASLPSQRELDQMAALDGRIIELQELIAADQEVLKVFISDRNVADDFDLPSQPEFRSIALRLPKLQTDLRSLEQERRRLESR